MKDALGEESLQVYRYKSNDISTRRSKLEEGSCSYEARTGIESIEIILDPLTELV